MVAVGSQPAEDGYPYRSFVPGLARNVVATPVPPTATLTPIPTLGPIVYEISDDVSDAEAKPFIDGIAAARAFALEELGGWTNAHPFTVRLTKDSTCGGGAYATFDLICLEVDNPGGPNKTASEQSTIAAHEYYHVLQAQTGCINGHPVWMIEGAAQAFAYYVLWEKEWRDETADRDEAEFWSAYSNPKLYPLAYYETQYGDGNSGRYSYWFLAADQASGADPVALMAYCHAGGQAQWQSAFATVFGLQVPAFYGEFADWFAGIGGSTQ